MKYPIVPGHEVVGVVDAVGAASPGGPPASESASDGMAAIVATATVPPRPVLRLPDNDPDHRAYSDGGYGEYLIARSEALAAVPERLRRGSRPAHVRRDDHLQRAAQ